MCNRVRTPPSQPFMFMAHWTGNVTPFSSRLTRSPHAEMQTPAPEFVHRGQRQPATRPHGVMSVKGKHAHGAVRKGRRARHRRSRPAIRSADFQEYAQGVGGYAGVWIGLAPAMPGHRTKMRIRPHRITLTGFMLPRGSVFTRGLFQLLLFTFFFSFWLFFGILSNLVNKNTIWRPLSKLTKKKSQCSMF